MTTLRGATPDEHRSCVGSAARSRGDLSDGTERSSRAHHHRGRTDRASRPQEIGTRFASRRHSPAPRLTLSATWTAKQSARPRGSLLNLAVRPLSPRKLAAAIACLYAYGSVILPLKALPEEGVRTFPARASVPLMLRRVSATARAFWGTAVPFGVLVTLFSLERFAAPSAIGLGVVAGALLGGIFVWIQKRTERRLEARGIDPGDLGPVQERSEEIDRDLASVYEAARRALMTFPNMKLLKENAITGELDGRTRPTLKSWGESISVRVTGDGPQTTVHISSRPRLSTTVVDNGKALETVALFFERLRAQLAAPSPDDRLRKGEVVRLRSK
jgi:hypothetical protein